MVLKKDTNIKIRKPKTFANLSNLLRNKVKIITTHRKTVMAKNINASAPRVKIKLANKAINPVYKIKTPKKKVCNFLSLIPTTIYLLTPRNINIALPIRSLFSSKE
ncbi:hypothetical protein HN903_01245 [archaeon]|nr:hypothetical protein [archaeon]MBT7128357.1 hypothetical protein [archaeon]